MNQKEFAELVLAAGKHSTEDYEAMYPERKLPEGAMVTRFAPSPTGFVHMGSLYASFADLQMAKQTKGVAYLRIEDTDQKREIEDGIEGILRDFEDLGIKWDEGPEGGNYGPYIQSERAEIYQTFARKLVEEGKAYPCFCSEEDLKTMREEQELQKYRLGYYGSWASCRHLSQEEMIANIKAGKPYIIRLKSPGDFNNKVILKDAIKGDIEMPENDIDLIIIKSDGLPTYHFAHAVDDHLMRTTHVIRGDEWVPSYPIHKQLFELLNFKEPIYAHLAPITIREGDTLRKLSKRKDPEASISFYRELGIPPQVINLYLATINNYDFEEWYVANPASKIDDFNFEFSKMPIGGTLFDIEKLYSISKIYFTKVSAQDLYDNLLNYTKEYDKEFNELLIKYKDFSISLLNVEREIDKPRKDIAKYSDIKELNWYMYDELFDEASKDYQWQKIDDLELIKKITEKYIEKYFDENDDKETWFNKMKDLSEEMGFAREVKEYKKDPESYLGHVGDLSTVLRVALTSQSRTPDLYELMKLLGKTRLEKRYKEL